jgi:uncharacterized membrane-anchored protein
MSDNYNIEQRLAELVPKPAKYRERVVRDLSCLDLVEAPVAAVVAAAQARALGYPTDPALYQARTPSEARPTAAQRRALARTRAAARALAKVETASTDTRDSRRAVLARTVDLRTPSKPKGYGFAPRSDDYARYMGA